MNNQNQDQPLETSLSPQDTPLQVTEQEVVPPVAEGGSDVKPKPQKVRKLKRIPPVVSKMFPGEEEIRLRKKVNKALASKFGSGKNASFKI